MRWFITTLTFLICFLSAYPQKATLSHVWPAHWIAHPDGPHKEYTVFHFRKTFNLDEVPDTLIVHTSGDNRYRLYVNDHLVTWGPLRGDLRHWYYESTNIAPWLRKGNNCIAAVVQNYGSHPPDAQVTVQTAFLLCADDQAYKSLNSNSSWKVIHNQAYTPNIVDRSQVRGYYGGGSREVVDGNRYTWNWANPDLDDSGWSGAWQVESAKAKECIWAGRWKLVSRQLPLERLTEEKPVTVRKTDGTDDRPQMIKDMVIPENSSVRIILDQGYETTAYPEISFSGGKDATITMKYSEAPQTGQINNRDKGNRNEIAGKSFYGYYDRYISDGGVSRTYSPLWWRAFRYIELTIETYNEPLLIHGFRSTFSNYPFDNRSSFRVSGGNTDMDLIQKILETGERTIRLCSHETFMDCPYYEESQFEGDSRIEALVSYYNFGDPSLGKNAIEQFSWSLNEEGFLSARYPTNSVYYIPNYSIFWIGMLYDYMMHYDDPVFIRSKADLMHTIMKYFTDREREDGSIQKPDYHNYVDWSFPQGEPPFGKEGYSALVDLHVLMGYQWAEAISEYLGDEDYREIYAGKSRRLANTIRERYWDESAGLFTDIPDTGLLSVHTNCMAIITGVSHGKEAMAVMNKVLDNNRMVQPTIYWHFYLFEALKMSGLGDLYPDRLGTWKQMIEHGCTTWPETGLKSRSECHGWGASPNYHFYKIVAGIEPVAPGFKQIKIEPSFGSLTAIESTIPHPEGQISMKAEKRGDNEVQAIIDLPENTTGYFLWKGIRTELKSGRQEIAVIAD